MGINVLRVDSWRVRNVFISDNGVSYEVLSHPMYTLTDQPRLYPGISFERYPAAKKCFGRVDTDIEVSVTDGIASFRGGRISSFIFGEPGEPYCKIPAERIKILNKFLGSTFNNSSMGFCKLADAFLFGIDKEHHHTDFQLTATKV